MLFENTDVHSVTDLGDFLYIQFPENRTPNFKVRPKIVYTTFSVGQNAINAYP